MFTKHTQRVPHGRLDCHTKSKHLNYKMLMWPAYRSVGLSFFTLPHFNTILMI